MKNKILNILRTILSIFHRALVRALREAMKEALTELLESEALAAPKKEEKNGAEA